MTGLSLSHFVWLSPSPLLCVETNKNIAITSHARQYCAVLWWGKPRVNSCLESSDKARHSSLEMCIIEAEVWPGLSMKINHVLHQRFFASASFKTSTDFFANNYLQHARGAILLDKWKTPHKFTNMHWLSLVYRGQGWYYWVWPAWYFPIISSWDAGPTLRPECEVQINIHNRHFSWNSHKSCYLQSSVDT